MVSLLDLPTETLEEIATHVLPKSNQPRFRPWRDVVDPRVGPVDLLNLCLTCCRLRDIVQPMIFKSIHALYQGSSEGSKFWRLTQTLTRRPHLAEKVKLLVLIISTSNFANEKDEEYTWKADLPKLALPMLALLSSVTSLHLVGITFLPPQDPLDLGRLISASRVPSAAGEAVLLPHLRALYISPENGVEGFVRMTAYIRFFGHPELRNISIYSGALLDYLPFWNSVSELDALESGSLNIANLNLLGCLLDQRSLRTLLQACANLKSLRYSQMDNDIHDIEDSLELHEEPSRTHFDRHPIMTPSTISFALEPCKDSLKDLRISFRDLYGTPENVKFNFKMLRDFTRLSSLDIEVCHLNRFDDLPSSLERLTLRFRSTYSSPTESLPPDLADFIEKMGNTERTGWPALKSVRMEGNYNREIWEKDAIVQQLMEVGTWVNHTDRDDPCCLVWQTGGVELTLCDPTLHWKRPGVTYPRWSIVGDDDT